MNGVRGDQPVVQLSEVDKRFGATQALTGAGIRIYPGTVHALVGENGAGKSSLGKVVAGIYRPDRGEVSIDGAVAERWDAKRARLAGVAMIAQELAVVPGRSVVENVFLGQESSTLGVLRRRRLLDRYRSLEAICQFGLDPRARVGDLRLAERQKVEIMRAFAREARVIVMDEPTSSLTSVEADRLHVLMRDLRNAGTAVVYVTHHLESVLAHCDTVTVMRDGAVVRTSPVLEETKQSLVEAMLGRPLDAAFPARPPLVADAPLRLETRGLTRGLVQDVSLSMRAGEIVGLAGLVGSGRTELARMIFGIDRPTDGEVSINGSQVARHGVRRSIRRGMGLVPEDRRKEGLVLQRGAIENISLAHLDRFSRLGVLRRRNESTRARSLARDLQVVPPSLHGQVGGYSGGNQQKVLFCKWLVNTPEVLILDEPTRGVDIGAKRAIYDVIVEIARQGTAVLLISSEHEEVLGLAHTVHLMRNGRLVGTVDPVTTSAADVIRLLFSPVDDAPDLLNDPQPHPRAALDAGTNDTHIGAGT